MKHYFAKDFIFSFVKSLFFVLKKSWLAPGVIVPLSKRDSFQKMAESYNFQNILKKNLPSKKIFSL